MKLYLVILISFTIFLILLTASQMLISARDDLLVSLGYVVLGLLPVYSWVAGKYVGGQLGEAVDGWKKK